MSTPLFAPLFQYIEANLNKKINIEDAARTIFLSPVHTTRLFSFAYGITSAGANFPRACTFCKKPT